MHWSSLACLSECVEDWVYRFEDSCRCLMFQLEEQTRFLKKHVCHAGVGTPNRVQALLKAGKFLNMATFISSGVQR